MKKSIKYLLIGLVLLLLSRYSVYADSLMEFSNEVRTCDEILGHNLTQIVHAFINILQISSILISIVYGMMILVPPILAKDADEIKKATSKLVKLGIVLLIILIFRPIIRFIGTVLEFDLSCIF